MANKIKKINILCLLLIFNVIFISAKVIEKQKIINSIDSENFGLTHTQRGYKLLEDAKGSVTSDEQTAIFNKAGVEFDKALRINRNDCKSIRGSGLVELIAGFPEYAIKPLKRALKCDKNEETLLDLANAYRSSGDFKNAKKYTQEILEININAPEAYNSLALICNSEGKFDDAIKYFKKAIELKPDYSIAITNLARVYGKLRDYNKAMELVNHSLEIDPNNATTYGSIKTLLNNPITRQFI